MATVQCSSDSQLSSPHPGTAPEDTGLAVQERGSLPANCEREQQKKLRGLALRRNRRLSAKATETLEALQQQRQQAAERSRNKRRRHTADQVVQHKKARHEARARKKRLREDTTRNIDRENQRTGTAIKPIYTTPVSISGQSV